ncbi:hypothetical protein AB595_11825 [Massilia sp. WF1]|nr:hypothetical protein AB595_11825 [Massilia sp. WF1]
MGACGAILAGAALLSVVLRLLRSLLSVFVLVFVAVRVVVTVLPPRATTESSACALSEKASVMAVTSKVLFIRFPLWV